MSKQNMNRQRNRKAYIQPKQPTTNWEKQQDPLTKKRQLIVERQQRVEKVRQNRRAKHLKQALKKAAREDHE